MKALLRFLYYVLRVTLSPITWLVQTRHSYQAVEVNWEHDYTKEDFLSTLPRYQQWLNSCREWLGVKVRCPFCRTVLQAAEYNDPKKHPCLVMRIEAQLLREDRTLSLVSDNWQNGPGVQLLYVIGECGKEGQFLLEITREGSKIVVLEPAKGRYSLIPKKVLTGLIREKAKLELTGEAMFSG